jgi:hypothetical protein
MRLTRAKSIELCIELWTWLAETGKKKEDWPEWERYGIICCDCWFCEYDVQRRKANKKDERMCHRCTFGVGSNLTCFPLGYNNWVEAHTIPGCKKYAKLFLKQIEALRK